MERLSTALVSAIVALCVFGLISASQTPDREYFDPRGPADTGPPPFSGAVRAGSFLFLSGSLGLDNGKVPESAEQEAKLVMDSMHAKLTKAGMTMDDLVSVQIFCSDVSHYDTFNRVYRTYFKKEFPARAFIGSGKLLYDARFEVQGIARKR
jgi:enamine deaminase RidA (YjgF/YER057c/UK114 family)